jgi:NADPH2:quinone reductase
MPHAIRIHKTGGPNVLHWEEIEVADPGPGQIKLRQEAAGLNFIDVYHRTGLYKQELPFTPGVEGAGIVEAVGEGVTNVREGDRVAYAGPLGGYAEKRLIDAERVVKLPDEISSEQAAGMMLQGMTAQMLLRSVFPVRAHGCAHPILYSKQDFVAEVQAITAGEKLPVVYDSVGRDTFMKSLDCLKLRGLMVSFGNASGPPDPIPPNLLAQKGSLYLTRPTLFHYIATREQLEQSANQLFDVVASGKVKIEVQQRFALKDAAEAHRQLEARKTTGSTILTV